MGKFLSNVVVVLMLSIFFFPMSAWSDESWKELEDKISDPCFRVNCNVVKDYIENLKKVIKDGNRKGVANYMSFPLRVNKRHNGRVIHYKIEDKNEFVQQYNSIMTKKVKHNILESNVRDIIIRYDGIGIGNGTIWVSDSIPPIKVYVVNID